MQVLIGLFFAYVAFTYTLTNFILDKVEEVYPEIELTIWKRILLVSIAPALPILLILALLVLVAAFLCFALPDMFKLDFFDFFKKD